MSIDVPTSVGGFSSIWIRFFQDLVNKFHNLPAYANNTAAKAGGLKVGDVYRTGGDPDLICVVH